jgi:hypothetical protein
LNVAGLDGRFKSHIVPSMGAQFESLVEYKKARDGGSCPDIVELDMVCKEVVIVEITAAADLSGLFDKITERQKHWFTPLRRDLESDDIIDSSWKIRFLGVVRETLVDSANAKFAGATDVHFSALERAAFSFAYWTER